MRSPRVSRRVPDWSFAMSRGQVIGNVVVMKINPQLYRESSLNHERGTVERKHHVKPTGKSKPDFANKQQPKTKGNENEPKPKSKHDFTNKQQLETKGSSVLRQRCCGGARRRWSRSSIGLANLYVVICKNCTWSSDSTPSNYNWPGIISDLYNGVNGRKKVVVEQVRDLYYKKKSAVDQAAFTLYTRSNPMEKRLTFHLGKKMGGIKSHMKKVVWPRVSKNERNSRQSCHCN
eukprot:gene5693-10940_t